MDVDVDEMKWQARNIEREEKVAKKNKKTTTLFSQMDIISGN